MARSFKAGSWWSYLPEDTYRTWKANEFKQAAIDMLKGPEFTAPANVPQMTPDQQQQPAMPPASMPVEGMAFGGVKSFFHKAKDSIAEILGTDGLLGGLDWEHRNVNQPIAGGFALASNLIGSGGGLIPTIGDNNPDDQWSQHRGSGNLWEQFGNYQRDRTNASGVEKFIGETATDPLTYLGGYGKAAEAVPGLRAVAPAISAAEKVPLWPLEKGMQLAGAGLRGVGGGVAAGLEHTPLSALTRETNRSIASRIGEDISGEGFALMGQGADNPVLAAQRKLGLQPYPVPEPIANPLHDPNAIPNSRTSMFQPSSANPTVATPPTIDTVFPPSIGHGPTETPFAQGAFADLLNPATDTQGIQQGLRPFDPAEQGAVRDARGRIVTPGQRTPQGQFRNPDPAVDYPWGPPADPGAMPPGPYRPSGPIGLEPTDLSNPTAAFQSKPLTTPAPDPSSAANLIRDTIANAKGEAAKILADPNTPRDLWLATLQREGQRQTSSAMGVAGRSADDVLGGIAGDMAQGARQDIARGRPTPNIDYRAQLGLEPPNVTDRIGSGAKAAFDRFWTRGIAPVQRAASGAILGTVGFPIGNVAETGMRSAFGGVAPERLAAGSDRLAGIAGLPDFAMRDTGRSTLSRALGTERSPSTLKNIATGQTFLDMSSRLTEPIQRNFVAQTYERSLADAMASGIARDEAQGIAVAQTRAALEKNFPSFGRESGLDYAIKQAIPFYGYEKSRLPYLAGVAAEHPQAALQYQRYQDETDKGNINIAGGWNVNPLKGTVLGSVDNFTRPDFPTYAQGKSGRIERAQQLAGKAGFFPGTALTALTTGIRAIEGEPLEAGRLVPPTLQTPLQVAMAAHQTPGIERLPGVGGAAELAANVQNKLLDDRFREFNVNRALAQAGINPQDATPVQRQQAQEQIALRSIAQTQSNVLGYKPEQETAYREAIKQAAQASGVPEAAISESSNPLSAVDPATGQRYLNAAQSRTIYDQHPEWEKWRQVTEPLKTEPDRAVASATRDYYGRLDQIQQWTEQQLTPLSQAYNKGAISGQDYRSARQDVMTRASAMRDQAANDSPEALRTPEQRQSFYSERGQTIPGLRPEDQAAQAYFGIAPPDILDAQGNKTGLQDFAQFRQQRDAYLAGLDPTTRDYIQNQYTRSKFTNPDVQSAEQAYHSTIDAYGAAPEKYLGISKEDETSLDLAMKQLSTMRQMYPWMDTRTAQAMIMQHNPRGAMLLSIANHIKNPARQQYLMQHPEITRLFSDAPGMDIPEF